MRRLSSVERFKLLLLLAAACALGALALGGVRSSARVVRQTPAQTTPSPTPSPAQVQPTQVEGCVTGHGQTEPMHKTRDGKLKDDGKDGQNLTCTSCHGGNPFVRIELTGTRLHRGDAEFERVMRAAHVAPRFPGRWAGKDGKY